MAGGAGAGAGLNRRYKVGEGVQCPNCYRKLPSADGLKTCIDCRNQVGPNLPADYFHQSDIPAIMLYGKPLEEYTHYELMQVVVVGHMTISRLTGERDYLQELVDRPEKMREDAEKVLILPPEARKH